MFLILTGAMAFVIRFLVYVVGGGILFAWIHPPHGLWEVVGALAWIGVCTVVDEFVLKGFSKAGRTASSPAKRASTGGAGSRRKGEASRDGGKRRGLNVLFTSVAAEEAERLAGELRDGGLHPIVVSRRSPGADDLYEYEVRVTEAEWRRAVPILTRFSVMRAES